MATDAALSESAESSTTPSSFAWQACSTINLHNALAFKALVLDGRTSKSEFDARHAFRSRPFGCLESSEAKTELLERLLTTSTRSAAFTFQTWFAYDLSEDDQALIRDYLATAAAATSADDTEKKKLPSELRLLSVPFETFLKEHPYYCQGLADELPDAISSSDGLYPSMVSKDGRLLLGTGKQATNWSVIEALAITHVVNISSEFECAFEDQLQYLRIDVKDEPSVDLTEQFEAVLKFVDEGLAAAAAAEDDGKGGRVLIHCQMGRSRSGTMAIASIMHRDRLSLKEAYEHVRACRPIVFPNAGFYAQLVELEKKMYDGKSTAEALEATGVREAKPEDKATSLKASLAQALLKKY